ncbi:MAG: YIP1 family protein [Fidelibacterota bacterium]
MHVFARLGNIVVAPSNCFTSIRDKGKKWTDYIIPFVLLLSMVIVFLLLTTDIMYQEQVDSIREMERLTPEQRQDAIQQIGSPLAISLKYIGGILQLIISLLFTALVFWIVGNFIGGGEHKYSTLLVSALYIQVITIPESIIKLFMILQKESVNVYLGLASFVGQPEVDSFGFQFLAQFEFFKIWRIILWFIAFRVLYRYSTKKSALLVGITMLLGMLISALINSMAQGQI